MIYYVFIIIALFVLLEQILNKIYLKIIHYILIIYLDLFKYWVHKLVINYKTFNSEAAAQHECETKVKYLLNSVL